MVMERPGRHAQGGAARVPGRDRGERGMMPPSPLRDAFQLLNYHLLFNDEDGIDVPSALLSIGEELDVSPHRALGEAVRVGLVERHRDALGRACVRRGPRSAEVLRRIYAGEPPTREGLLAEARAWREFLGARRARLESIREAARPKERNTIASLPAWVP